jgi:hypothetical protein
VLGEEERKGGEEALTCGVTMPERESAARRRGGKRRQAGPGCQREKERDSRAPAGEQGGNRPGVAAGPRGKEAGLVGGEGKGLRLGWLFFSFSSFLFQTNSILFEFK